MEKRFVWKIDDGSMEFSNGRMQNFEELVPATSYRNVMYFYYDLLIRVGKKKMKLSAYDFPKIQYLGDFIQTMLSHDTLHEGYLLENVEEHGFVRKVRYHQMELEDTFSIEHFFRLEKYCYEVKQEDEQLPTFHTFYKMTIGEIGNRSDAQSCMAWHIETLSEAQLLELVSVANDFIQYSIEQNNIQIEQWKAEELQNKK